MILCKSGPWSKSAPSDSCIVLYHTHTYHNLKSQFISWLTATLHNKNSKYPKKEILRSNRSPKCQCTIT